jgi:hypothetical protein
VNACENRPAGHERSLEAYQRTDERGGKQSRDDD